MKRQTPKYWQDRMATCLLRRRMHMEDARWADSQNDDDGVQFHVGMAEDASWELRYCKRELRKLEQHLENLVTCDTCGKQAEREDAQDAGWLFYEEAECDECLEARTRDAFREYRRDRIEADHEASKRAKYAGLVP